MNLSVYWGIFTCALLVPAVLGVQFCPKKGRLPLACAVVARSSRKGFLWRSAFFPSRTRFPLFWWWG